MARRHKCFAVIDSVLETDNTRLVHGRLNTNTVYIQTERIKTGRGRPRARPVPAPFCPFCGKRLPKTTLFGRRRRRTVLARA